MSLPSEPYWLAPALVLAVHEAQIALHGGELGLRDAGLLASAYSFPAPDTAELAALYALGIIRNHPFLDGNKRVGLVLLETFLELNGARLEASDEECFHAIIGVASSKMSDVEFCVWVRAKTAS